MPTPEAFRIWLAQALVQLQLRPVGIARDLDLGKNTLGDFLGTPGRDLRMGTAARVHAHVAAQAAAAGVTLPPMGEACA